MARRDAALESRLAKVGADKASITAALAGFAAQQAERRGELERLQAADRAIFAEFEELTGGPGGGLHFYGALLRVYKRRVKRARRREAAGGDDEKQGDGAVAAAAGVDSDSDSDSDDGGLLDDDDEEEGEDDSCPDGCDKPMYERVLGMRSRRLDVEEAMGDVNKALDELRRRCV